MISMVCHPADFEWISAHLPGVHVWACDRGAPRGKAYPIVQPTRFGGINERIRALFG